MSDVHELLTDLASQNVKLWTDDNRLRVSAPKGVLTTALQDRLRIHKIELMTLLDARDGRNQKPALQPQLRSGANQNEAPLSYAQQRLWFVDQLEGGGNGYVLPSALRLVGKLDVARLQAALNALVARHESLRTTFDEVNGELVQCIHPPQPVAMQIVPLRHLAAHEREAEAQRLGEAEARRPFDLKHGPLMRCTLYQLDEHEHVLFILMHHIVADGWSVPILAGEVTHHYANSNKPLPPLEVQYADFAQWQRSWLHGNVLQKQLDYWTQQLADAPPLIELPTDRPRAITQTFRSASVGFELGTGLVQALTALAQRHSATLYMVALAAYGVMLSRYSRQSSVVIGSPTANRTDPALEPLIGFFVNTLPMRVDVDAGQTFEALLQRVKQMTLDAYANQDAPFEQMVDALKLPRALDHTPLFQVMLAWLTQTGSANLDKRMELPGLSIEQLDWDKTNNAFELVLSMTETPQGLVGALQYWVALYDEATAQRMVAHFKQLLADIATQADQPIYTLPMLSAQERQRLLVDWNAPIVAPSNEPPACAHALFEAQVLRTPDAIALIYQDRELSYAELNAQADALAQQLRVHGVAAGDRVAICAERSIEMMVAVLGVLKAGAAYVPLDPTYPAERLAYMLNDAQVKLVLAQAHWVQSVVNGPAKTLAIDELLDNPPPNPLPSEREGEITSLPRSDGGGCRWPMPSEGWGPDSPIYIIYTSGSTGQPKGVVVPHKGVANTAQAMARMVNLGVSDRLLQFVPFAFDASALEFFATLTSGATLVLHPNPTQLSTSELHALCAQQRITTVNFTVALWQQWVENLTAQGARFPAHLRTFLTGGDKPFAHTLRAWAALADHEMRFVCSYGPTEAAITTTAYTTTNHAVLSNPPSMIPLGAPLPNMSIYIVDAHDQLVPVGVAGELVIGGLGVADGYWQREELTRERFVSSLPAVAGLMRFYRTGDLARWLPDGRCEFVGRADTQVKIRGFRIELGEIEAQLKALPQVREAVVLAVALDGGDKRMVAYYQPNHAQVTRTELIAALRPVLAPHMLPSAWVALESFPLTPNGKLDRNALPKPDWADDATAYVAPRNAIESKLAQIWQEVLGVQQVGVESNFFDLGGHSLLATQMVSRIRQTFGLDVPLRALFESPTIAALVPQLGRAAQWVERPALTHVDRAGALPLSFSQQRLWLLQQINPESSFFNMPLALRLDGALSLPALQASFDAVVCRHEMLRTHFPLMDGTPVQHISESATVAMRLVDAPEDQFAALAFEEAERPFDLLTGPLMRVTVLRANEHTHALLVTMHHIIGDNWSLQIFMREFTALYAAQAQGAEAALPALPFQFVDFAQWQRTWLQGDVLKQQLAYWENQLDDAPALLELPTDHPRPAQQRFVGDMLSVTLPDELTQQLRQLSRDHGTTLHMTLLAGFATLLARYSSVDDLVIGIPIAGRNDAQVEPMIGYFLNTLALRFRMQGHLSFADVLQQAKQITLDAYAHQDAPFEQVIEEVNPTPQLSHAPIFQVLFDVLQDTSSQFGLPNVQVQPIGFVKQTSKYDINLVFSDSEAELSASWEFNTDLFERATIARMAQHFQNLLRAAVAQPNQAVSQLPLLSEHERQALLIDNNQTQRDYPLTKTMPQLFAEQVARTPNAIAVSCSDDALTYAQLNARADAWAQALAQRGVQADVIVAPFFERGIDFLTAILAIFKAGGAYLPLDPHTPTARIRQIFVQSQTPMVQESVAGMAVAPEVVMIEELSAVEAPTPALPRKSEFTGEGASPSALAYIIFTSGSTGVPKGVMVEQRGLVNHLCAMRENLKLTEADVIGQTATQSYVISVWQFLAALVTGARVQIVPEETMLDTAALLDEIERRRVSVVQIVPSMMRLLIEAVEKRVGGLPACVRWMIPTGEALPPALARTWFRHCPNVPLLNAYGSSECSDDVAHDVITAPPADDVVNMPAGYPIPNVHMFVLDAHMQPAPVGVAGELYVGGAGVGRGYLFDEALTAQKFISRDRIPLRDVIPNQRLYKTGDRACVLPNGKVAYLGRLDFQVKIRGIRIELGEIEATLGAHPSVAQSVVVARDDAQGLKQLLAYVVLRENATANAQNLRAFVGEQLPNYMVPAAVIILAQMPLNTSGKVARNLLPQPKQVFQADAQTYIAPRNETEAAIAEILSQVMGLDAATLGVRHNFFDLGGHSMQAIQVVSRMRDRFGLDLPLRSLFERTTVEGLAQLVAETRATQTEGDELASATWSPLVPLQLNPTQPPVFFVHAAGGALFWYLGLLKHLGTGVNAYGLQGHGLRGDQQPLKSIPEMAKLYCEAIKQAHPHGPYHLVGYSMGGLIAYEIARQFRESGDEVGVLALLDSYVYTKRLTYGGQGIQDPDEKLMMQMLYEWDDREAKKLAKQLKSLPSFAHRNQYLLETGQQAGLIPPSYALDDMRRQFAAIEAHIDAIDVYKAQPYDGALTHFRCKDRSEAFPARDWRELVRGELKVISVPGKHSTLMDEPNVIEVAKQLHQVFESNGYPK